MRRWLPRSLWLLAWSLWAWLGWGLYRELPRGFGPPLCRLTESRGAGVLGFLGDSDTAVVIEDAMGGARESAFSNLVIRLHDGRTGAALGETALGLGTDVDFGAIDVRGRGVLAVHRPAGGLNGKSMGVELLNLHSGAWRRFGERQFREAFLHPDRPWVAFVEEYRPRTWAQQVVVYDLETGREVFATEVTPTLATGLSFFVPGAAQIVVASTGTAGPEEMESGIDYEVWEIANPSRKVKSISRGRFGRYPSVSRTGRVAYGDPEVYESIEVYDLSAGQVVFSLGFDGARRPGKSWPFRPTLSEGGKSVLGGRPLAVWNVDDRTPIWRGAAFETPWPANSNAEFMVIEHWFKLWERWLPSLKGETRAFRRLSDGSLIYRTASKEPPTTDKSAAGAPLLIGQDGAVYRGPAAVNWPLLLTCQAILALPLVLLWAALRWRRKRRMRMAGGTTWGG